MLGKEEKMKKFEISRKKLENLLWNVPNVELILYRGSHDFDVVFYGGTYDVEESEVYGHATIKDVIVGLDADLNVTGIAVGYDIWSDNYAVDHFKTLLNME